MSFINLDLDYFDHPKTKRLIGLLGKGAAELPIRLWCYCGKYHAESGSLTDYSNQEIESIVGWWGKEGEMVEGMQKVGLLEKVKGGWKIKDWMEINGHLAAFSARAKAAAKVRWGMLKHAPSNATSNAQASPKQCPNLPTNLPTNKPPNPLSGEWDIPEDLHKSKAEIQRWLEYKREKGQRYKPRGLLELWRYLRAMPEGQRGMAIEYSMASNYAGIYPAKDRFGKPIEKLPDKPATDTRIQCYSCHVPLEQNICPKCHEDYSPNSVKLKLNSV